MMHLDKTMMQDLSFPDMEVEKMEFLTQKKELRVFVNGAFLDVKNGGLLGKGSLHFNEWESISIRRFNYSSQEWTSVNDTDPEQLDDLCEVKFSNSDVLLCGFGKTIGKWLEWKITKTKMHAEFEDECAQ